MRNICLSATGLELAGYETVPFYLSGNPLLQLHQVLADGEATHIVAEDILEFVRLDDLPTVVADLAKKLSHGGTITLSCRDLNLIIHHISSRDLPLEEANTVLFGQPATASVLTSNRLMELMSSVGLQIIQKRFDNLRAIITGQRP